MNLHEYQAKQLLQAFDIPISEGFVANTADQAHNIAQKMQTHLWVVKAQIHAGGRGKAGGVKLCKSLAEVKEAATLLLGSTLITHQTGSKGQKVHQVYIESGTNIAKEFYLSFVLNRNTSQICIIASAEGGVDIEKTATHQPNKILKFDISPASGIQDYHVRAIAKLFGVTPQYQDLSLLLRNLYRTYIAYDCSLLEINPLVLTKENTFVALDAKISIDDNALPRQKNLQSLYDSSEDDPAELEAKAYDLSYVKLDGTIGCLVNGAGLAMATMDIIQYYGGSPANFLDVGGSADKDRVAKAFEIILKDSHVKAVLVNIFGGIMHCDIIAEGIIAAMHAVDVSVPLVVRLQGTNKDLGASILKESKLNIITADDLADAAQKAVAAVG